MGTAFTEAQMLDLSDVGVSMDPCRRRLLLAAAGRSGDEGDPGLLSLGAAERLLLDVRRQTFGERLGGSLRCPACGTGLAVQVEAAQLIADNSTGAPGPVEVEVGGLRVRAHPPTLADLVAARAAGDRGDIRRHLISVCVVSADGPSGPVAATDLPDEVIAVVGESLVAADPFVELCLEPTCDACGTAWPAVLDVGRWLWDEVEALAVRLVDQVHSVAAAYGWSEAAVLSLSPRRRQGYVERVVNG